MVIHLRHEVTLPNHPTMVRTRTTLLHTRTPPMQAVTNWGIVFRESPQLPEVIDGAARHTIDIVYYCLPPHCPPPHCPPLPLPLHYRSYLVLSKTNATVGVSALSEKGHVQLQV